MAGGGANKIEPPGDGDGEESKESGHGQAPKEDNAKPDTKAVVKAEPADEAEEEVTSSPSSAPEKSNVQLCAVTAVASLISSSGDGDGATDSGGAASANGNSSGQHRCCCFSPSILLIFLLLTLGLAFAAVSISQDVRYDSESLRQLLTSPVAGEDMYKEGWRAHFPVVFVPGIVSTGLELWQGADTSRSDFRQRIWGSSNMLRHILLRTTWWLQHIQLDPESGLDPPGIKLRASLGLQAADYLIPGYWVWAKMIESLGAIGYDSNNMLMAAYDWRLSFRDSQRRDLYLTKLKTTIELARLSNQGRKVVILAHSMGCTKLLYFLQWVQHPKGGNAGPGWIDENIHTIFNIGGPFLGVPKAVAALVSGEMRDTAELSPILNYLRQHLHFDNTDLQRLLRSFRSIASMLPHGGERIWGSTEDFSMPHGANGDQGADGQDDGEAGDDDDDDDEDDDYEARLGADLEPAGGEDALEAADADGYGLADLAKDLRELDAALEEVKETHMGDAGATTVAAGDPVVDGDSATLHPNASCRVVRPNRALLPRFVLHHSPLPAMAPAAPSTSSASEMGVDDNADRLSSSSASASSSSPSSPQIEACTLIPSSSDPSSPSSPVSPVVDTNGEDPNSAHRSHQQDGKEAARASAQGRDADPDREEFLGEELLETPTWQQCQARAAADLYFFDPACEEHRRRSLWAAGISWEDSVDHEATDSAAEHIGEEDGDDASDEDSDDDFAHVRHTRAPHPRYHDRYYHHDHERLHREAARFYQDLGARRAALQHTLGEVAQRLRGVALNARTKSDGSGSEEPESKGSESDSKPEDEPLRIVGELFREPARRSFAPDMLEPLEHPRRGPGDAGEDVEGHAKPSAGGGSDSGAVTQETRNGNDHSNGNSRNSNNSSNNNNSNNNSNPMKGDGAGNSGATAATSERKPSPADLLSKPDSVIRRLLQAQGALAVVVESPTGLAGALQAELQALGVPPDGLGQLEAQLAQLGNSATSFSQLLLESVGLTPSGKLGGAAEAAEASSSSGPASVAGSASVGTSDAFGSVDDQLQCTGAEGDHPPPRPRREPLLEGPGRRGTSTAAPVHPAEGGSGATAAGAEQEVVAVQVLNVTATLDWIRTLAPHFMFQLDRLYSHGVAPALSARDWVGRVLQGAEAPSSSTPVSSPPSSSSPGAEAGAGDAVHSKTSPPPSPSANAAHTHPLDAEMDQEHRERLDRLDAELRQFYADDDRHWINPLETQLPNAPNLTILCAYGVGKLTERGYFFKRNPFYHRQPSVPYVIDADTSYAPLNIYKGVRLGDGDGTVPLISLGYMCQRGWRLPQFNPHGVRTVVREYKEHSPARLPLMRAADSADHVDIMGNYELIEDVIRLVGHRVDPETGKRRLGRVPDRIYSRIREVSEAVELD